MAETRFAWNGEVRVAFEARDESASRDAPWLVLVHGLGYGRWGWGPVVDRLAERFRLVLVDNRGVGDSDVPEGPYTAVEMAADVVAVLDEAGIGRAHLVATSLGGMIAQELAFRHPERVARLVLVASTAGGAAAYPMPERTQQLIAEMTRLEPRELLRRAVENALHDDTVRNRPELVESIMSPRLERPQDPAGWRAQAAAGVGYEAGDRLRGVGAPTLVVHGEGDHVVDPRNADLLTQQIPDARQVRIPGAGHLVFWEAPDRFVREVTEFLLVGAVGARRDAARAQVSGRGNLCIGRWIRDRAVVTPERVAIDFVGSERPPEFRQTRYEQLDMTSERLAAGLLEAGLTRGDRVATLTGNRPEHVELLFACAKAGLILTPLNWRLAAPEVAYQLDDAEPAVLFVERDHEELANAALAQAGHSPLRMPLARVELDDLLADDGDARHVAVEDDDPILLVYTSGTTGMPKGALLTHANCFWTNLSLDRTVDLMTTDVVLQILPQFHVGGWNVQPLLAWWKGATVVLERGFDPGRALVLIEEKRITTMMGVPAAYLFMSEQPGFAEADLSSLRQAVVGGAPMPEALLRTWQERGVDIVQGYGLTEAAPNVLCLPPELAGRKLGSAGKPYPHVEVKLRDVETGRELLGPARGELAVRGPNVFPGYWRNEEATRSTFSDGWLLTGDVAERDQEGFYRICDRTKDMFISGGENVYPAEVESVLHDHPQVVEAAVVGVPHERWGEVGIAFVVMREPSAADGKELLAFCRDRLAKFKVPQEVRFVAALPRSAVDKVLKTELLERYKPDTG